MTGIGGLLTPAERRALLERLRHIEELATLIREPGAQRPPPVPHALAALAGRDTAPAAEETT